MGRCLATAAWGIRQYGGEILRRWIRSYIDVTDESNKISDT
jgi:hypothetical protein